MAYYLNINAELKEKARVQKNGDNQYTQGFKQIQGIPENEGMGGFKLVLQNGAHPKIEGIPQTEQDISPLPDVRYVV